MLSDLFYYSRRKEKKKKLNPKALDVMFQVLHTHKAFNFDSLKNQDFDIQPQTDRQTDRQTKS